ncbi:MAG: dTDP-4-dehydrorhamnose 3,5-epimerase [Candidatus Jorgensenbacteria bacterium]
MRFRELNIKGVFQIELEPNVDGRGFFMRMYDKEIFRVHGLPTNWVQESRAFTKKNGTIRGLHFLYPPKNESKLISVLAGEAFWVFVDIRKNSPTLGKWGSIVLSAEKHGTLFIPRGFANGMCTLSDNCHVLYRMDNMYDDNAKSEFKWDDPTLAIPWPVKNPTGISERDQNAQSFEEFLKRSGGGIEVD